MRPRLPTAIRARQQAVIALGLRRLTTARARVDRGIAARNGGDRHRAELIRLADERRHLALEVVAAEEDARRRIAEDLHDGALQTLLAAKQDLAEASPGRAGVIRAMESVDEGIDCLRRAVGTLHPVTIEHDGLAAALGAMASDAGRRGAFQCVLRVEEGASGPQDHVLISLVRELLTNVAKHAGAGQVIVSVSRGRGWLHLEVSDDGCGFDPAGHLEAPCNGHIGLASVEHRVHALGGSIEIVAGPETGTDVSVRLPAGNRRSPDPAFTAVNGRPNDC